MAFGYSYLLDMYGVRPGACDNLELNYRFLEELVHKIGMTPMTLPFIIHAPRNSKGEELFPDKAGISGFVPLIESGIAIHTLEPSRFITLDVYSCNCFDKQLVWDYAKETFGFEGYEEHFVTRGTSFGVQPPWTPV